MEAKRLMAFFLLCVIVIASVHVHTVDAGSDDASEMCYNNCFHRCKLDSTNSHGHCQAKCGMECITGLVTGTI